jgi:hypothetical protein
MSFVDTKTLLNFKPVLLAMMLISFRCTPWNHMDINTVIGNIVVQLHRLAPTPAPGASIDMAHQAITTLFIRLMSSSNPRFPPQSWADSYHASSSAYTANDSLTSSSPPLSSYPQSPSASSSSHLSPVRAYPSYSY